jgi:hypothetical protein
MVSFYKWLLLKEEIIRNINIVNAIKRSGISPEVLQHARGVMTINQFMENPPSDINGGYALGLTKSTSGASDIYWHLAAQHNLQNWETAYKNVFGSTYWKRFKEPDITDKFLTGLMDYKEPVVFFVPSSPSDLGRYTREELEYFTKYPEKASHVYFVFGSYDMISDDDYKQQIEKGRTPGGVHTLMQHIISDPSKHRKQEEY